ncbi:MAG: succinate dehydrogenase/fumarate reductase iron-sulfur subunit [Spirochaetia bacterium]|nr:succinate dehydrogenase/fumarate reductase iron-sulfur subunit [Spirochaetia bacterium]
MEEQKEISFRIYRYNPHFDKKPYYDNIRITLEKGITVLRALNFIKENIDSKLTFRAFCQAGICGSCGLKINGVSKLACMTQVFKELEDSKEENVILIEPLNNFTIMRDLVVDMDPLVEKLKYYYSWVNPKMPVHELGKKEYLISEEKFQEYDQATDCILCASCVSECLMMEVNPNYISPAVLLKSYRMNVDERDSMQKTRLKKVTSDGGVWDCTHCYKCVEHCVKNIDIMKGIQGLRNSGMKTVSKRSEGAKHAKAFITDIKRKGRLVEFTLITRTLGFIKPIFMLPMMIKMLLRRRVPPPSFMMSEIPRIEKVRKIFRKLKKKNF